MGNKPPNFAATKEHASEKAKEDDDEDVAIICEDSEQVGHAKELWQKRLKDAADEKEKEREKRKLSKKEKKIEAETARKLEKIEKAVQAAERKVADAKKEADMIARRPLEVIPQRTDGGEPNGRKRDKNAKFFYKPSMDQVERVRVVTQILNPNIPRL